MKKTGNLAWIMLLCAIILASCAQNEDGNTMQSSCLVFSLPEGVDGCFISGVKNPDAAGSETITLNLSSDRLKATGYVTPQALSSGEFTVSVVCGDNSYSTSVRLSAFLADTNYSYALSLNGDQLMVGAYATIVGFKSTEPQYVTATPAQ